VNTKVCPKCGNALTVIPYVSKGPKRKHERYGMLVVSYYCSKCKKQMKNDFSLGN